MPTFTTIHDVPTAVLAAEGDLLRGERDVTDLIGELWEHRPEVVVVPASRLPVEFFDLSSRIAGEIAQKFANYHLRLVIVGDIDAHVERSSALADLVRESNQGRHLWFLPSLDAVAARLAN